MMNIKLMKFQENDFKDYYSLVSNEKVMAQITERSIPLEEARLNYQKILQRNKKHESFGTYKIFDASGKRFIGLGSLILNEKLPDEAEIGYMILPEHWGQGYGTVIAKALIRKVRGSKLKKLEAVIDPNNIPSRKILTNLGFKSEKVCTIDGLTEEIICKFL
jgi:[ribosomal protein S5]-alanine N-acetyltransferase